MRIRVTVSSLLLAVKTAVRLRFAVFLQFGCRLYLDTGRFAIYNRTVIDNNGISF